MVTTDNPMYKRNLVIPLSHHHYGLGNRACVLTCVPCLCLQYWRTCFHLHKIDYAVKDPSPSMMTPTQAILIIC